MLKPIAIAAAALSSALAASAHAQRATGIDVSYWQGSLTQTNWNSVAGSGIDFAFVRATRGGTTGTFDLSTNTGTLSRRYDDPYFANNMNRAKSAGILAGAYHFLRADVISGNVEKAGTDKTDPIYFDYTNTGLDEANHFLAVAGAFIKPGFLRPVLDIEAGNLRTPAALTSYALAFSDRVFAVTGVRPIVYLNTSYATSEVTSALNGHDLWLARYTLYDDGKEPRPTADEFAAAALQAQTIAPPTPSGYSNPYGVWNTTGSSPWDFWQYTNAGRVSGIGGYVDHNVANGDVNFVRTFLVPEPTTLAGLSLVGILVRRRRDPRPK